MKKVIIFTVMALCSVVASAKTFLDKTNINQLDYRVLDAGQVAWNEEDGSAVIYVGSPSEVKNIRVIDPAALSGFRYREIDDLVYNAGGGLLSLSTNNVTFKWTSNEATDAARYHYEYIQCPVTTGSRQYTVTNNTYVGADNWYKLGFYVKNGEEYEHVDLPDGMIVGGTNQVDKSIIYYIKHKYMLLTLDVISKDNNLDNVDYYYYETPGGLGEVTLDPITTTRTITYNGRQAHIEIKVDNVVKDDIYCGISDIEAWTVANGDIIHATDLSKVNFYFYDSLTGPREDYDTKKNPMTKEEVEITDPTYGAFNLYKLREWGKNLYNGNRGEDWAKYTAAKSVNMGIHLLSWKDLGGGGAYMGASGKSFIMGQGDRTYLQFNPAEADAVEQTDYRNVRVVITKFEKVDNCWTIWLNIDDPDSANPTLQQFDVLYAPTLNKPIVWYPTICDWVETETTVPGTREYIITIPEALSEPNSGFWKVVGNFAPNASKILFKAGIQMQGEDGLVYDITFPNGGGTVTATLVE